ncbi:hypothetical protein [Agarilytica rhodophyticola]|uniref:hypothetical protein n=1 Tax=Agarilytica rhodophyticola TaxID=1737490 RepID=UPI000CD87F55|nr:hypothetical protein [Agarilytica rhodophyticola]
MLKPPYISNEENISAEEIEILCEKLILTKLEISYLKGIHKLSVLTGRELSIMEVLDDRVKSTNGARKRLETLFSKGAIRRAERKIPGKNRPVIVYKFKRLGIEDTSRQEIIPSGDTRHSILEVEPRNPMVSHKGISRSLNSPAIDDLLCSVLFAALEFNRQGKGNIKPVKVEWYGEKVDVITRCVTGLRSESKVIARVTDLKYWIAMLTISDQLISHALHLGETPKNFFAIEIGAINEQLKKENSGGNIETALKALTRLADTVFDIENLPQRILDRFNFEKASQRIEPISNFGVYEDYKTSAQQRKTITITYSFPEVIFQGILSDRINIYRINPEVLTETNEVMFALHLFNRRLIGTNASMHYKTNLRKLKMAIVPDKDISFELFCKRLALGLEKKHKQLGTRPGNKNLQPIVWDDKKERILSYYASVDGYYIRIRGGELSIHIDPTDSYVGLNSLHHSLKKKSSIVAKLPKGVSSLDDVDIDSIAKNLDLFDDGETME